MKKSVLLAAVLLLGACSDMSAFTGNSATAGSSTSARMKTCLTTEAGSRYQAGTLFTSSIKDTATDLVKTCTKKLALESAGISAESQATAENIISNLKSLAAAQ